MNLRVVKATAYISAALLIAAPAFGRQGDVIKKGDNGKTGAASTQTNNVANPKKTIFDKLSPLRQEPGRSGNTPKSRSDVYWECILPERTGVPKGC